MIDRVVAGPFHAMTMIAETMKMPTVALTVETVPSRNVFADKH
jgi:hypothetical protein